MKLLDDDVSWQRAWHIKQGKAEEKFTNHSERFFAKTQHFFAKYNFTAMASSSASANMI